jgi:adenine deaminase
MVNRFAVAPLHTLTRTLADVASGRLAPDLVITGGRLLSTYTEHLHEGREVWVKDGRVAAIKPAGAFKAERISRTIIYDARGGIVAPGLVDPHVHIEGSLVTACAYAEAALMNGTTTIFCDSHELANVYGERGVDWMIADARRAPLSIFLTVPSTVPATSSQFETAGGELTAAHIGATFDRWPEAVALGEKKDYLHIAAGNQISHDIVAEALKRGRPVCGHVHGREFVAAYAASGITDTHEAIDREQTEALLEAGMWVFMRGCPPGSARDDLPRAIRALTEGGANPKRICVCTDERDTDDLFAFGLDWVVRQAQVAGVAGTMAWSFGTLHPATRYAMDHDIGGLGAGRRADIVLLDDDWVPRNTWYGGQLMIEDRKLTQVLDHALSKRYQYPPLAQRSFGTVRKLPALVPTLPAEPCTANVMRLDPDGYSVRHERIPIAPISSWEPLLTRYELCFLTVVGRHAKNKGLVAHGLLQGFGLKEGAVASSVNHDAHNVILAGTCKADLETAYATIKGSAGGICVVRRGEVLAHIRLPIAGLLSDRRASDVALEVAKLKRAWTQIGCTAPLATFTRLSQPARPELRLTDQGLVRVPQMKVIPLFAKPDAAPARERPVAAGSARAVRKRR